MEEARDLRIALFRKNGALTVSHFDPHRTESLDIVHSRRDAIHRAIFRLDCIFSPARYIPDVKYSLIAGWNHLVLASASR